MITHHFLIMLQEYEETGSNHLEETLSIPDGDQYIYSLLVVVILHDPTNKKNWMVLVPTN